MINKIDEKQGFKGLIVTLSETPISMSDVGSTHIELWQIANNEVIYSLGRFDISRRCIDAEDIIGKLLVKYKGKLNKHAGFQKYIEIRIMTNQQEALDWLISIVMIYDLANDN